MDQPTPMILYGFVRPDQRPYLCGTLPASRAQLGPFLSHSLSFLSATKSDLKQPETVSSQELHGKCHLPLLKFPNGVCDSAPWTRGRDRECGIRLVKTCAAWHAISIECPI